MSSVTAGPRREEDQLDGRKKSGEASCKGWGVGWRKLGGGACLYNITCDRFSVFVNNIVVGKSKKYFFVC